MNDMPAMKELEAARVWGRGRVLSDISESIGNTPLVRLARIAKAANAKAEILMKLEFFSPLSSVKDRVAAAMLDALEAEGRITRGKTTLVEATSGSMGLALASLAAVRGYRLVLVLPESASLELRKFLALLGARIELTPGEMGIKGAIARAAELGQGWPDAVIPAHHDNPANASVHERTTAEEIWADTGGNIDAIVLGVGSGGTLTGCGRALKARKPDLRVIAVEPAASAVLSGGEAGQHRIEGLGAGFVPGVLDTSLIDEVVKVRDDIAVQLAQLLARVEGIAGGISTGANLAGALTVAARDEMAGKTIVTLAPSSAGFLSPG